MTAFELMHQRRTIRRFTQQPVTREQLLTCVEAARVAPSGANLQPLAYKLVCTPEDCAALFPFLTWAGYLAPNGAPPEGERPTAYIVVVHNSVFRPKGAEYDAGAACMSIILAAQEMGLASCWIASVKAAGVEALYGFPENLHVLAVLALGYPAQKDVEEPMRDGNVRYWLDDAGTLHVPKRSLEDILL